MTSNIAQRAVGIWLVLCLMSVMPAAVHAAAKLKPFILVSNSPGDAEQMIERTRSALMSGGFEIVGEYEPYSNAHILIVTNDALKANAAKTKWGAYGAVQRVSVTTHENNVQVAYTNPVYMANAYRMAGDLSNVARQLEQALGKGTPYGAEGLTAEELRNYHYKILMPYFDDPYELGEFDNHKAAVESVETGLEKGRGGASKVYRVEIPGKDAVLFGVRLTTECSGDKYIMERVDFADIKSTPHLPYEVLVSGDGVYALAAKFRIAQSFPDLSMMGSNSFMSIMCAPEEIEAALVEMTTGKAPSDWW